MTEITNYTTLASVAAEVAGRSMVTGAMTLATADINRRLRVREMLSDATLSSLTLPSDFLEAETVQVGESIYSPSHASAQPGSRTYSIQNGALILEPVETTVSVALRYYARLAVLSGVNTNDVLDNHPDVYLYGLLAHHAQMIKDSEGVQTWRPLFIDAVGDANRSDAMSRQGALSMRPVALRSA